MSKYINADKQERIMKQNDKDYGNWVCVVRCKDCKWCRQIKKRPEFGFTDEVYTCDKFDAYYKLMTPKELNDFCSYGERKDNDK